jgi:DNA polymerase III delta subunit
MIYILHGEDIVSSRQFISSLQQQNNIGTRIEVSLEDTTPELIREHISGVDMFGASQMVVFDVSKMGRTNVDDYLEVLREVPKDFAFVVLTDKKLSKANAFNKNASKLKAKVMLFKGVKKSNVFKFADLVFEKRKKEAYKELRRLILAGEDPIGIFAMLTYGLRNIAYAKFNSPMINKVPPFVKSKAAKQAVGFSESEVLEMYKKFYEMDRDVKSGELDKELLCPLTLELVATTG